MWTPIPWVTADMVEQGHLGGEGGQWVRAITADSSGTFLLYGTDVGGLYRSTDGGLRWQPCNVGYTPRGTAGLAIDPHNSSRCLSVGANSTPGGWHGIYLSTDKGASWKHVMEADISGSHDMREQLAYDGSSYNADKKKTMRVYWSRISNDEAMWGTPIEHPALYRSDDGGETWVEIPGTQALGGSILRVHPLSGLLYAGNEQGLFRSSDCGHTFEKTMNGPITGLDVTPTLPDAVFSSTPQGVWVAGDAGKTFTRVESTVKLSNSGLLRGLKVSPADPKRMLLWREGTNWQWVRYASMDGGQTWKTARIDSKGAFLPTNAREGLFAWHPTDPDVCWSTGGDYPTRSTDGGRTWRWSADGFNAVLVGGMFNFNLQTPDLVFMASQDYNGAFSIDGGRTWKYTNPSGNGWGGFTYGAYAASDKVMYVGNADGWGAARYLTVTRDGGRTWKQTALRYEGPDVSYGHPSNPDILFASNLRSSDGGVTWTPMKGCSGVYTSATSGKGKPVTLYGVHGDGVVTSTNGGATWALLFRAKAVRDIAVDAAANRIYVASEDRLKVYSNGKLTTVSTPKDQLGGYRVKTVAVDPVHPSVVYIGSSKDIYSTSAAVCRSTDAGKTWTILSRKEPLSSSELDGGREAICIRVHPKTREAWVATSCYGIWKVAPPRR